MAVFTDELTVNWVSPIKKEHKHKYLSGEPWFCNKCKRPWQGEKVRIIEYLANFPLIGCTFKICPSCESKGARNEKYS